MKHLQIKKGWYYYVKKLNGKVKWIALHTQDEPEALKKWARLESNPQTVRNASAGIAEMSLSELQGAFREHFSTRCTPNTVRSYERALKTILEALGDVPVTTIERKSLINLRDSLFKTPYEANLTLRVASIMLQFALDRGYVTHNMAFFLKKYRESRIRLRLDVKTLMEKILPAAAQDMKTAILLAWQLSQHENEVRLMKWENIDLREGKCTFIRKKTGKQIVATLSPKMIAYLQKLPQQSPYIISSGGIPYSDSQFREMWRKAVKDAELLGRGYMFKEIRHLSNSIMNVRGVAVQERMKLTGHSSISVNERYTHDLGEGTQIASNILGEYLNI